MNRQNTIKILKSAGEGFTVAAGITTIILGIVGAIVAFPIVITLAVAAGVGVTCALIYGHNKHKNIKKAELLKAMQQQELAEIKVTLDEIKGTLELHTKNDEEKEEQLHAFSHPHHAAHFIEVQISPIEKKQAPRSRSLFSFFSSKNDRHANPAIPHALDQDREMPCLKVLRRAVNN